MRCTALALCILASPAAVAAADRFAPPEGCEVFVTAQMRDCTVTHHFTCEGDAAGDKWRIDLGPSGPVYMNRVDDETQWVESFDLRWGITDTLDPDPAEAASFTDLVRTGRDDFDFTTTSDAGETIRYRGRDLLTGQTVVIDGVPLLETETFARATDVDGDIMWESTGNEFVHLDWRLFLPGQYITRDDEGRVDNRDGRPVSFDFPGDEGFLSRTPLHNCDAELL
ncbi:MAG: hypothetical protein ACU0CO_18280 [Shimia sp.]